MRGVAVGTCILIAALLIVSRGYAQDVGILAKKEFMMSHQKMSKGMMVEYTGNVDADFIRGMIPHHQGAVDMCNTELKYGSDEEILQLCRNIIASQEEEIAFMKKWLKRNGQKK